MVLSPLNKNWFQFKDWAPRLWVRGMSILSSNILGVLERTRRRYGTKYFYGVLRPFPFVADPSHFSISLSRFCLVCTPGPAVHHHLQCSLPLIPLLLPLHVYSKLLPRRHPNPLRGEPLYYFPLLRCGLFVVFLVCSCILAVVPQPYPLSIKLQSSSPIDSRHGNRLRPIPSPVFTLSASAFVRTLSTWFQTCSYRHQCAAHNL